MNAPTLFAMPPKITPKRVYRHQIIAMNAKVNLLKNPLKSIVY
jgi:hypothetical protein